MQATMFDLCLTFYW